MFAKRSTPGWRRRAMRSGTKSCSVTQRSSTVCALRIVLGVRHPNETGGDGGWSGPQALKPPTPGGAAGRGEKMRVLLINPPTPLEERPNPPLGLAFVAAALEEADI